MTDTAATGSNPVGTLLQLSAGAVLPRSCMQWPTSGLRTRWARVQSLRWL
jgi:hypothetical protein